MQTAIVIPVVEAERIVGHERLLYDPTCVSGMPAHITLVTPFAPPPIASGMVAEIRQIVRAFPPTELRFRHVGRFPNTVYLKPEPGEFVVRLTQAIVSRWPKWMPYGGGHADIIPHLTVADRIENEGLLDEIAALVVKRLPVEARVHEAWLMEQGPDEKWRRLVALPFGTNVDRGNR
jgi:2'-5' RNA ligase